MRPVAIPMLAASIFASACASGQGAGQGRPRVVVTTSILGDIVSSVVGDAAEVDVLMPAGVDPHAFEVSARQATELRSADLVVANGLGLEGSLEDVLAAARDDGVAVLEVAEELDPIPFRGEEDEHAEEDAEEDEDGHDADPHVWFDPDRMARGAEIIAERFVAAVDDAPREVVQEAAERYADRLRALSSEMEEILDAVPVGQRKLVTNHEALAYFADRFGFEVIGVVIPGGTTLAEAGPAALAELAATMRRAGVRAIFAEHIGSAAVAESLAREAGVDVEVVTLFTDALGPPGSGADTYPGLLATDARLIAGALAP